MRKLYSGHHIKPKQFADAVNRECCIVTIQRNFLFFCEKQEVVVGEGCGGGGVWGRVGRKEWERSPSGEGGVG